LLSMVRMLDIWDIRKKVVDAARKLPAHKILPKKHRHVVHDGALWSSNLDQRLLGVNAPFIE